VLNLNLFVHKNDVEWIKILALFIAISLNNGFIILMLGFVAWYKLESTIPKHIYALKKKLKS